MFSHSSVPFPLVTTTVDIGGRVWSILAVESQDALLDSTDDFEEFPYGFLLWEAAVALARTLTEQPALVAGKRVLELGAGVGVPGLVARALGAKVWQTDYQPGALALAEENARRNNVEGIQQFLGDWRNWTHTARYDILLGADILYQRDTHFHLERIFDRCLAPDGRLLLADPNRPQAIECAALLEKHGWQLDLETRIVSLQAIEEQPPDSQDVSPKLGGWGATIFPKLGGRGASSPETWGAGGAEPVEVALWTAVRT